MDCDTQDEAKKFTEKAPVTTCTWTPGKGEWAAMGTMAVVSLMVALDATILVPALPTLAVDLHGTANEAFWAGTSFLLTSTVFQPLIVSLSDIFGRKELLLVSIFFFTLGTLICAPIAHDMTTFLAGRSIQGIGGGGIISMGQVVYADIVPLRQRPKYFAMVLGAWAIGTVSGPLLGGAFVNANRWRWCFYINLPICGLGFVLVPLFVRLTTKKTSLASKLARVDWIGGFLFVCGLASFLIGLSWAGTQFDRLSIQTLAPIFVGLYALASSIAWERFVASEPFLSISLFLSPSAVAAYATAFGNGFILFCTLYYGPFYFMAVRFTNALDAGIRMLPVTCLLLPGSVIVSVLSTRLGRFRWAVWIGWVISTLSCGLMQLFDQTISTPAWAAILAIFGAGNGMVLTGTNVAIQAISPAKDCGRAATMYAFMRSLGMTVGVAVGGTTFQNVMILGLDKHALPHGIARHAEAYVYRVQNMSDSDPTRAQVLDAYVQGFHGVFWLTGGVATVCLLGSIFIRKHSMDKELDSNFVLRNTFKDDRRHP
ncbi:major facilitator superfamily domain-containing protein [Stachybotrys elegans]|uniref:Major facilitator superfamily domain-containing protein n=1 Tax=Stachybotrys elegans TaxID=80388 RepID=A0A8K0SI98_9HYPO|nr:major facilitator superfamily domain-containing protein [Stachybotrys elegans]